LEFVAVFTHYRVLVTVRSHIHITRIMNRHQTQNNCETKEQIALGFVRSTFHRFVTWAFKCRAVLLHTLWLHVALSTSFCTRDAHTRCVLSCLSWVCALKYY